MHRRAWWLLLLTLVVPGSAQLVAGSKRLARIGITATLSFWIFFGSLLILGLINKGWAIWLVTLPILIWVLSAALILYSILFALLNH